MTKQSDENLLIKLNNVWEELDLIKLKVVRKRVLVITGWDRHKVNLVLQKGTRPDEVLLLQQALKQALSDTVVDIVINSTKLQAKL